MKGKDGNIYYRVSDREFNNDLKNKPFLGYIKKSLLEDEYPASKGDILTNKNRTGYFIIKENIEVNKISYKERLTKLSESKYVLTDEEFGEVAKYNTIDEAKRRAKISYGIRLNFWSYDPKTKAWYTNDGGTFTIKKI